MVNGLISATDIARIKASGVTTKIVDATRRPQIQPQGQVRLIYGSSKIGVFNRAVFIEAGDVKGAIDIYGERDRQLERKGSWFHHALEVALEEGAVLALSLLKTNDETDSLTGEPTSNADVSEYKSFSLAPVDANGTKKPKLYSSFFKKDRFWSPDDRYLLATRDILDQKSLLNFVNLSQRKLTFIVKKSNVFGFDVPVKEWYGNKEIPKFLRNGDLISDYFLDVFVVAGDFSNYEALSNDVVMSNYFDKQGLIASKMDQFLALNEVSLVNFFQGCIIPNFVDKDGSIKALDRLINSGTDYHGIMCGIDKEELDAFEAETNTKSLDLVGHNFLTGTVSEIDMLSYKRKFSKDSNFTMSLPSLFKGIDTSVGYTAVSLTGKHTITIINTNPDFANLHTVLENGTLIQGELTASGLTAGIPYTNPVMVISNISKTATTITFDVSNELKEFETALTGSYIDIAVVGSAVPVGGGTGSIQITQIPIANATYLVEMLTSAGKIVFGSVTVTTPTETITTFSQSINNLINAGTGSHGFSGVWNLFDTVSISYDGSDAHSHNGDVIKLTLVGATTGSLTSVIVALTGGNDELEAGAQYDTEITGFYSDGSDYIVRSGDDVYASWENGTVKNGDIIKTSGGDSYLKFTPSRNLTSFENILTIDLFSDIDLTVSVDAVIGGESYGTSGNLISTANLINIITSDTEINRTFVVTGEISQNVVRIDYSAVDDVKIGQLLEGVDADSNPILVRITGIRNIGSPIPTELEITASGIIKLRPAMAGGKTINRFLPFNDIFDRLQTFYLKGLEIKETHMPNNTNVRMKEILSVMIDTPIRKALVDPDMVTFRYMVDTFNHGLEAQSKRDITRLVRDRSKAMALLNMPSTTELSNSTNPAFKDAPTASNPFQPLKAVYIAEGGNKFLNPDFLMSRPEEEDGASHSMWFYPNIAKQEDDFSVSSVPPALYVSNNFVRKWKNGDGFKATAGTSRGVITGENLLGLEHELDKDERGELETKGINPLRLLEDGTIVIYGNQTGYHKFRSILNQANSRDTLITIEIDTENILNAFIFENAFSDDIIRETIKTSITNYLASLRDQFKAIETFSVKFDRQNNPDWVISESASILDVEIKMPYVTRKFISRITLVGGSAQVGSFTAV